MFQIGHFMNIILGVPKSDDFIKHIDDFLQIL